jgi:peptide-methionine (S)-S-oxide reductase
VRVEFDPSVVSYDRLLDTYWGLINPNAANDPHAQYRATIFYTTPEQKAQAEASKRRLEQQRGGEVTTFITPAATFWRAEEYHQHYYQKNHMTAGCHL